MTPIVLIHGFLGSSLDWRELLDELPNSQAIDIPATTEWSETVDSLASQIPENAIVCGYSMGARLALGCILRQPDKFQGLIFVSGNPGIADSDRRARLHHDLKIVQDLKTSCPEVFLKQWYAQSVFSGIDPHQFGRLMASKRDMDSNRHAKLLTANSIANQPNYWPQLVEIDLPALVIAGERDKKYVSLSRKMVDLLPDGELEIVPECGHIVQFEQSLRFLKTVAQFRNRLSKCD